MRFEELLIILLIAGAVLILPVAAIVMSIIAFVKTRKLKEVTGRLDRIESYLRDVANGRVTLPQAKVVTSEQHPTLVVQDPAASVIAAPIVNEPAESHAHLVASNAALGSPAAIPVQSSPAASRDGHPAQSSANEFGCPLQRIGFSRGLGNLHWAEGVRLGGGHSVSVLRDLLPAICLSEQLDWADWSSRHRGIIWCGAGHFWLPLSDERLEAIRFHVDVDRHRGHLSGDVFRVRILSTVASAARRDVSGDSGYGIDAGCNLLSFIADWHDCSCWRFDDAVADAD
jgi:hypothetical protein